MVNDILVYVKGLNTLFLPLKDIQLYSTREKNGKGNIWKNGFYSIEEIRKDLG